MTTKVGGQYGASSSNSNDTDSALAPALGESWAHACTNRIILDWTNVPGTQQKVRVARLLKSPFAKMGHAYYAITAQGVRDLPDYTPDTSLNANSPSTPSSSGMLSPSIASTSVNSPSHRTQQSTTTNPNITNADSSLLSSSNKRKYP